MVPNGTFKPAPFPPHNIYIMVEKKKFQAFRVFPFSDKLFFFTT